MKTARLYKKARGKNKKAVGLLAAGMIGLVQIGCGMGNSETASAPNPADNGSIYTEEHSGSTDSADMLMLAPADFTAEEQLSGTDTIVTIGSLVLTLPLGWELEQRVSENGLTQYVLADVHSEHEGESTGISGETIQGHSSIYEHEILITPYEIKQMPERTLQLAAEMKAYFPVPILYGMKDSKSTDGIKGCRLYGENNDTKQKEYFLFSETGTGARQLFHVQEGNTSVTAYDNEIESFWHLIDSELVRVNNGTYIVQRHTRNSKPMEYYFLFNNEESGNPPLLMKIQTDSNEMSVYRTGNYESPLSVQEAALYPEWLETADINQDGYEDFLCRGWLLYPTRSLDFERKESFDGYLWDEDHSTFVYVPGEQMLSQYASYYRYPFFI